MKIDMKKMDYIEINGRIPKPMKIILTVLYVLVAIFAVNNLVNYFN